MAIRALRDLVYIIPMEDPDKIGSIYVPEQAKQRIDQGIVKYRGDAVMELRVGDHVIFSGYSGDLVITEDDGPLYVMKEMDIFAVLHDDEKAKLFTERHVLNLIDKAAGIVKGLDGAPSDVVDNVAEHIKHVVESHTFEELRF